MRCEHSGPSSALTTLSSKDGSHRKWLRTGMEFMKPSTKASSGNNGKVMYHKFVELRNAINVKKSVGNKKVKALWSIRDAKAGGDAYFDRGSHLSALVDVF